MTARATLTADAEPIEQTTTSSGVRVVSERVEHVRSAAVGCWIATGSRDEPDDRLGAAHLLEHLVFRGTARRDAREIAEALDGVGGELNALTAKELTCFHAHVLDQDLPLAVDVLGDLLAGARNRAEDLDAERAVVRSEIDALLDDGEDLALTEAEAAVVGAHPLARDPLGTARSVAAMPREAVHEHYLERYRPADVVVAAAGRLEHRRLVELVETHLGDLGRPGSGRTPRHAPQPPAAGTVTLRDRPTEQVHLAVAMPGVSQRDERRWAVRALTVALGGSASSRLFQTIREQHGLAYTTYAQAAGYGDAGVCSAYLATPPAQAPAALELLTRELDRAAGGIRASELARAQSLLRASLVLGTEDTASRMSRLGKALVGDLPHTSVDEALARIDAVTADEVAAVAAELLRGPRHVCAVGPLGDGDVEWLAAGAR